MLIGRILLLMLTCLSCSQPAPQRQTPPDTPAEAPGTSDTAHAGQSPRQPDTPPVAAPARTYANDRFRNVTVQKVAEHRYEVSGAGQLFEAAFSWVVEDGHEELLTGHGMTDAGAPEWGRFRFPVEVRKRRPASTLTLILFESSPKDGSRQHELPIVLE